MMDYINILRHSKLFSGVGDDEIEAMTSCLQARVKEYKKGEYVYRSGEHIRHISILVKGALLIQKDDYWGNRTIINKIEVGEIFGEAHAMQDSEPFLNNVLATEASTVLSFDVNRVLSVCPNTCKFHNLVIQNLVRSISAKNRMLHQKIDYMSKRTTRDKLVAYLSAQSMKSGSSSFEIPFNRQQLADFLGVDRSAMSNELCKMRDDGMLEFDRSHFRLKQKNMY